MTPPTLSKVWQRDELEVELRDALALVEALEPPEDLRVAVFQTASTCLLQRVVEQPTSPVAIGGLGRALGRG